MGCLSYFIYGGASVAYILELVVNPETGLLPQVEVPDRLGAGFELDVGDVVVATFFTAASYGQGPPHLQAMALLIPRGNR